jgi:eukaryotic-like serine/threonine-protein kinase
MGDDAEQQTQAQARLGTMLRNKYRLDAVLGVGGMAVVYKATHRNKAEFAIKMLHPELCARQSVRTRFLREGYAANSVKHAGVVRVVDDDVAEDGSAFLVMELLDGVSADHLLEQPAGPPPLAVAVAIGLQLLDVLAAAHANGIVHRDIKPANLFLTRDGSVKVLDFGIARALDESSSSGPQLTGAGMPLGTPAYMAPEQALAKSDQIDAQTDVWAAGATLFALLTGDPVHSGEVAAQVLVAAATTPARRLASAAPGIPEPIAEVVDRALAFDKAARWPSAGAMRDALAAARLVAGVDAPSKEEIAALFPGGRATSGVSNPAAFAPTAESIPPAARPSASRDATQPAVSSTGRPVRGAAPARRRWRKAVLVLGVALLLLGVARPLRRWRARTNGSATHAAPSSSAALDANVAPTTSRTTVLVLEMANDTSDPLFDRTLDAVLMKAIGQSSMMSALALDPLRSLASELETEPLSIDEQLAKKLLARDGGTVITVRGRVALSRKGPGYALSIMATDSRSGAVVFSGTREAEDARRVVPNLGWLASRLRAALGDSPPTDPRGAEETTMSASLEADRAMLLGTGLANIGKYEEGAAYLRQAVALDPGFARAHDILASVLWNMGRRTEAVSEYEVALRGADNLGELERLELQADYLQTIGAYDRATAAFEELLGKRRATLNEETALTELYWETNQMQRARDLARRAAAENPQDVIALANLACSELRASDVERAREDAAKLVADFPRAPPHTYVYLGLAEELRGQSASAADAYGKLLSRDASLANHGLADLALSEGRFAEATTLLVRGLAADIESKNHDATARKRVLLAETRLRRGDPKSALEAARKATGSEEPSTLYAAGEVDIGAHDIKTALSIASDLAKGPGQDSRMYGKLLEADALRADGKERDALVRIEEAQRISDSWLGHLSLARAHLDLGEYADAEREVRVCIARRGEGVLAFDADAPSARLVPPLTYYLARALEGQHRTEAKATYESYLALVPKADHDPLADDARRRLGKL